MTRRDLQKVLETLLGSHNVYFQPPETIKIKYPAILYSLSDVEKISANNGMYHRSYKYELTLIDKDPESKIVEQILALPLCTFDRHYKSDNLNHFTFSLYVN